MASAKFPHTAVSSHQTNLNLHDGGAVSMTGAAPLASRSNAVQAGLPGHTSEYFPHQIASGLHEPSPLSPQQRAQAYSQVSSLGSTAAVFANARLPSSREFNDNLSASLASRPARFTEEWDATQRGGSIVDAAGRISMQRSNSFSGSTAGAVTGDGGGSLAPSRGNTLKKKPSVKRGNSLKRSSSRRSMKAGSVRSLALHSNGDHGDMQSAFCCPVPTSGNPTEALANRFQAWRRILKDLITYFREVQTHYEHRSKSLLKLANVLNNTSAPPGFLATGGLDDALQILRDYNKKAIAEANRSKDIEDDVILALTGLRSDLHQKIKEIRNLSGDFKNTVEKEMEATRRAVNHLQENLGQNELESALSTGKQDPYLLRLAVDRQLERQIDEENYLHQAYLNLENSGRELESIVVGEIQKSWNAYAGILKRESDTAYSAIEDIRAGPIAMPKETEWLAFIHRNDEFVDPEVPVRSAALIHYPGRDHDACQEIRAGLLERKSKYLKSYTAGWYVLSTLTRLLTTKPTHLHEFKSADKTQGPVMSLYLPGQKLGSHSTEGGSSNKFILKGRQTGAMHRGHTWVFRAESHETMMAWYEDIQTLTEKSPEERSNFVRVHSRSFSRSSQRSVTSSDGVVDEDDEEPFAAASSVNQLPRQDEAPRRPSPGGRFPSDVQVDAQRGVQVPLSPLSASSSLNDNTDFQFLAAGALAGNTSEKPAGLAGLYPGVGYGSTVRTPMAEAPSQAALIHQQAQEDGVNPYTSLPHRSSQAGETKAAWHSNGGVSDPVLLSRQSPSGNMSPAPDGRAVLHTGTVNGGDRGVPARPLEGTLRSDSVPTISSLHIPGEYPNATPTA